MAPKIIMILDETRPSVFHDRYEAVAEWSEVAYVNCAKFEGEISGKARVEPGRERARCVQRN